MDPLVWLPGITASLYGQSLQLKYPKKGGKNSYKETVPVKPMTLGKVLWKKFLLKLKDKYIKPLKKDQRAPYKNINARAIVLWSKDFERSRI